ncbi:MAG: hypothetical protein RMY62_007045 [Nostoc sp. ZfuVER08]|uniref:Uncharacterized protein n=1 Tax=Nostoc punctiforme FACHB-252 TaxID=1357509 RepID=A0ABR8HJ92_NOSPU|nr:hypothetical protein [Nostoc punctiforme]MBD2615351.1 hypothetical protein [Nostoc punctiforme FACHB-252]MDZ8010714.1 hypothetical protein [Nostoc sp. ZfuVER08]
MSHKIIASSSYFGDAYGWLRLRICYFSECNYNFGDAYGGLSLFLRSQASLKNTDNSL